MTESIGPNDHLIASHLIDDDLNRYEIPVGATEIARQWMVFEHLLGECDFQIYTLSRSAFKIDTSILADFSIRKAILEDRIAICRRELRRRMIVSKSTLEVLAGRRKRQASPKRSASPSRDRDE